MLQFDGEQGGNDDPKTVDDLLSKELLELSIKDRTAIQEEIHGVKCLALTETPELLEDALFKLAIALDNDEFIPPQKKKAYRKSQELDKSYVNEKDFRLRFLRFTLFDAEEAAEKIVNFLEIAMELFGEFLLERAVRLSDFDNRELKYFREGEIQLLPFRDRSGRRILVNMNSLMPREDKNIYNLRSKIMLYMIWVAGEDVDVQRKGLVFLVRFTSNYELSVYDIRRIRNAPHGHISVSISVRPCAVHICSPCSTLYRLSHAFILLRIKQEGRMKIKIHYGESVELQYALHSYGIPTEHIPLTFSGNIKDGNIKQWLKGRVYAEAPEYDSEVVECPQLEDVLFRQGVSSVSYRGNSRVHRLIEKRYDENLNSGPKRGTVKSKREKVVQEIIKEMHLSGGRFLVWNDHGWWSKLSEVRALSTKLEYFIKEVLRTKRKEEKIAKNRHRLNLDSSTSMFHSRDDGGSCQNKRTKLNSWDN